MPDSFWLAVTAIGTAAMAIAVIVTAIYAGSTLKGAKNDSRERTRPIIAADLRREPLSHGAILLGRVSHLRGGCRGMLLG